MGSKKKTAHACTPVSVNNHEGRCQCCQIALRWPRIAPCGGLENCACEWRRRQIGRMVERPGHRKWEGQRGLR
ncbi:unnamed protein product [Heterosigma akashiwo]